jgi:hypothetical protein
MYSSRRIATASTRFIDSKIVPRPIAEGPKISPDDAALKCRPMDGVAGETAVQCAILGINHRGARAFPQRARNAGERKILERCRAACGLGNNMVDVKRRFLAHLREPAIFASFAGSQPNTALQRRWNVISAHPDVESVLEVRRRSRVSRSARSTSPSASACSSFVSATPPSCLSSNACSRRSTPSGSCSFARSAGTSISKSTFALVLTVAWYHRCSGLAFQQDGSVKTKRDAATLRTGARG